MHLHLNLHLQHLQNPRTLARGGGNRIIPNTARKYAIIKPMDDFLAACIQMSSGDRVEDNLHRAGGLIARAAAEGAQLAVLPEFFPLLSADETAKLAIAEADGEGPIQDFLAQTARAHGIYLVGGTVPLRAPAGESGAPRVYAASPFYAPDGSRLARYDKIHLFQFHGKDRRYDETHTICAGDAPVAVDTSLGRIALSVCFDLRFPELYRRLQPDIIVAPSAFTPSTGKAHWQLLLTARAVENLAHVIGAAQAGEHGGGRRTHGNSMVVAPWGNVLAQAHSDGDEVVFAEISAAERQHWRGCLPALDSRKLI